MRASSSRPIGAALQAALKASYDVLSTLKTEGSLKSVEDRNDEQGKGGEKFQGYTYAVRPPGAYHGPFKSEGGCILLETHFYEEA